MSVAARISLTGVGLRLADRISSVLMRAGCASALNRFALIS